jgi:hypothetical protein
MLQRALGDARVSVAQRAQIRALLATFSRAQLEAVCTNAQPAGSPGPVPRAQPARCASVSALIRAAGRPDVPAQTRKSLLANAHALRSLGDAALCNPPRPNHTSGQAPASPSNAPSCSLGTYRRALRDASVPDAAKAKIRAYLALLRQQQRSLPYC